MPRTARLRLPFARAIAALLVSFASLAVAACSAEPGSSRWCAAKAGEERKEWTIANWDEFSELCFEVGSEDWCDVREAMPKDDWGLKDVGAFALHCMDFGDDPPSALPAEN